MDCTALSHHLPTGSVKRTPGGIMKVKDIMEPLTNWLTPEMTILEAIRTMQHTKRGHGLAVNGIVVLDHEMKLVGILSTRDILRIVIPSFMYLHEITDEKTWVGLRLDRTAKLDSMTVGKIMTEDVRVISYKETILRCADLMLVEQRRRLPVIGTEGKVLGVVYLRDVYNAVTNLLCHTRSAEVAVG